MKTNMLTFVLITLIVAAAAPARAGSRMNPGSWEITTRTQMAGMPTQTMTHTQCITSDDQVPVSREAGQECRVTDIVTKGNTVSWKMSCGGEDNGMTGTGSVTYNGSSMSGKMDMTVTGGANMRITNTMTGRRIGDCDGSSNSAAGTAVANDLKDVGAAAKDEAKQSTIDAVRGEVRGLFDGMFD